MSAEWLQDYTTQKLLTSCDSDQTTYVSSYSNIYVIIMNIHKYEIHFENLL